MVQDGRIVADGPAAANIPGVVAGLDYLYRNYGSGKVKWAELIEPAITLADEGFILDEGLPSSIAEGRRFLEKWPEAAKIYLPDGKVPRPGDRFFNKDYASTLRAIQQGRRRRRSTAARSREKIAADMEENGGIIDLCRPGAVSRDRARAGRRATIAATRCMPAARRCRPASSCSSRCTCSRTISRKPGARAIDRCRLPALPDRIVEGARSAAPRRRSRALAGGLRRAPDRRAREEAVREDRSEEGVALRAAAAGRRAGTPPPDAAHLHRHDVVCRRRRRRQHDRRDADAEHVGRHVLRVEGAGLPLQQPPAIESHDAGRLRQPGAADAIDHGQRADAGVREDGGGRECRSSRWAAPATPGFRCRSTTSSPA